MINDKGKRYNSWTCSRQSNSASCSTWPRCLSSARVLGLNHAVGIFREDYPSRDDVNFMRHTMAYRAPDGAIALAYKPVVQTRYLPWERKYALGALARRTGSTVRISPQPLFWYGLTCIAR